MVITNKKRYLTPTDVATLLRVSPITVRQWAQKGKLPAESTPGGHRRFLLSAVEAFAREHGLTLQQKAGINILIVDDDPAFASYLGEQLSLLQGVHATQHAPDGFAAGRMLHTFLPDIVLLDLRMPGLDGIAVCAQIKADPTLNGMRVIMMSGHADADSIARAHAAGAEICLSKPFTTEQLRKALNVPTYAP